MVVHACNTSTQEIEAGRSQVLGQLSCKVRLCLKKGRKEGREGGRKGGRKEGRKEVLTYDKGSAAG
jgi:hypothetical protein